ncbi:MAG: tetratricopeptide repeat protein, partial [Thiogranum sp.]
MMMQGRFLLFLCTLLVAQAGQAGLFENREQQAARLFEKGKYEKAAGEFTDGYRRGVAQYRAGQYAQASESFEEVDRESVKTQALYNLGNSRFQEGKLEAAAEAYRNVLLRDSSHEDASHNLGLTSAMLAEAKTEAAEKKK